MTSNSLVEKGTGFDMISRAVSIADKPHIGLIGAAKIPIYRMLTIPLSQTPPAS